MDIVNHDYTHKKPLAVRGKTEEIIVHCSATPEGRDYSVYNIDSWHKAKGWNCIGYHYIVYRDGSVHRGRSQEAVGAHCNGHNAISVGVCYIGGVDAHGRAKDTRTRAQKASLVALLKMLLKMYPKARIYGHRNFAIKDCPSFDAKTEYSGL